MAPPKRPWFRVYVETVYDRKLRRLPPSQRWLWIVVLAFARQSPVPGVLLLTVDGPAGPVTSGDLADASGLKETDVKRGLTAMESVGMIRRSVDTSAWEVVNWTDRQYESDDVTKRTREYRERNADTPMMERSIEANGTPPENREQKTENTSPSAFAEWWLGYPRKVCKADAERAYAKALKRGATPETLRSALDRWRKAWEHENRPHDKIPHAATWLNGDRWQDEFVEDDPEQVVYT